MTPFGRALWHIEAHYNEDLTHTSALPMAKRVRCAPAT